MILIRKLDSFDIFPQEFNHADYQHFLYTLPLYYLKFTVVILVSHDPFDTMVFPLLHG
jgi:hypothetical protein